MYDLTGEEKYIRLAECYQEQGLFRKLDAGEDGLTDDHANASIPLAHGAARMYEVTGDEKWRRRVEQFWNSAVMHRGMYSTGGQNAGEFWIPPMKQAQYMGERNQEFCTVYNMVRTAWYLYKWSGEAQYADYIERCLYNGFLAQQNAETGMPAYFLPLASGSKKKWGSRTRDFWCCHGTMVQAQTLYGDLIYFMDDESRKLFISQYIPSRLEGNIDGTEFILEQVLNLKNYNSQVLFDEHGGGQTSRWSISFHVKADGRTSFTVALRIPEWIKTEAVITVTGKDGSNLTGRVQMKLVNGYMNLTGQWEDDEINVFFPSEIRKEFLPDQPELAAFVDGPIVLAGMTARNVITADAKDQPEDLLFPRMEHTYGTFTWSQNEYVTRKQAENFRLVPLYDVTDEIYTIYFSQELQR